MVCGGFDVPVSMSTLSHHLKVLREAGLVRVTPEGSHRRHELRTDEIESRYPGVLSSVIAAKSLADVIPVCHRRGKGAGLITSLTDQRRKPHNSVMRPSRTANLSSIVAGSRSGRPT